MTRPRTTDPAALLLFVTEPQQLDAVFEYGTETLSPASIRADPIEVEDDEDRCPICGTPVGDCDPSCYCTRCENERALDDDADAYYDREV